MISQSGEVLFEEEFKGEMTVARNGRFLAKNSDGLWEIYTADHKPKKIGGEYVSASAFCNGYAFVAEKNKPVSIIDTDGKTVKVLDKIEGKTVTAVSVKRINLYSFFRHDGYYVFNTQEGFKGVINYKGECVIKPVYDSEIVNLGHGLFLAYKKDNDKVSVLDSKGKVLFTRPDCEDETFALTDDRIAWRTAEGKWGVCDLKGEWIIKPSETLEIIGSGANDDEFIFSKDGGAGVMNMKKETVIRATKYDGLYYDGCGGYLARYREYFILNDKGEKINEEKYDRLFPSLDGKHYFAITGKYYTVITADGKEVKGLPDINRININEGDQYVESDYVDMEGLIASMDITADGIGGFNLSMYAKEVVEKAGLSTDPEDWCYKSIVEISEYMNDRIKNINDIAHCRVAVHFPGSIGDYDLNYDYSYGYGYYGNYTSSYKWNSVHPDFFMFNMDEDKKMHGKTRDFYTLLCAHFKKMGTEVKHNENAMLLRLNNGKGALVFFEDDKVNCLWGFDYKDIDINQFAGGSSYDDYNIVVADTAAVDYDYGYGTAAPEY